MPVVPPAATLTYEVELLDFTAEDDAGHASSLPLCVCVLSTAVLLALSARRKRRFVRAGGEG